MDGTLEDNDAGRIAPPPNVFTVDDGDLPDLQTVPVNSPTTTTSSSLTHRRGQQPPSRQVSSIDVPKTTTGIVGTSSNLVNSIVGAGIIGIPYAIASSGLIAGIVLLILVGFFTDKSLRMIIEVARFHPQLHELGVLTFEDLMTIPFGRYGRIFILTSMFVLAYGAMVAYLLIVKDNVPTVLGLGDSLADREGILVVTSLLIMLPLSMLRDISQLAFTSTLSVLADVVLIIIVCVFAPVRTSVQSAGGLGEVLRTNSFNSQIFIGLGILSTALACQHSSFLISGSLKDTTPSRWARVTCLSVTISTALCLILGVVGYLGYLEQTQGDVLNNFPQGSAMVDAARLLLSITMFLTYPMESFVARHVLIQILYNGNMDNTSVNANGEQVPEAKLCGFLGRRELWTILLYIMTLVPALLVDDLGPVLSLTGSLGASSIAYIAPGLAYLGMNGQEFLAMMGKKLQDRDYHMKEGNITKPTVSVAARNSTGEVELPVIGDAEARIQAPPEATSPDADPAACVFTARKPWWWWLGGFPIWIALASQGAYNSKQFLRDLHEGEDLPPPSDHEHVRHANKLDFFFSIVFIVFGVVAAVFGVLSNLYVQVNQAFFEP